MGSYGSFCLVFCLFVCFLCFCFVSFFGGEKGQFLKWLQSASKVRARHIVFLSG